MNSIMKIALSGLIASLFIGCGSSVTPVPKQQTAVKVNPPIENVYYEKELDRHAAKIAVISLLDGRVFDKVLISIPYRYNREQDLVNITKRAFPVDVISALGIKHYPDDAHVVVRENVTDYSGKSREEVLNEARAITGGSSYTETQILDIVDAGSEQWFVEEDEKLKKNRKAALAVEKDKGWHGMSGKHQKEYIEMIDAYNRGDMNTYNRLKPLFMGEGYRVSVQKEKDRIAKERAERHRYNTDYEYKLKVDEERRIARAKEMKRKKESEELREALLGIDKKNMQRGQDLYDEIDSGEYEEGPTMNSLSDMDSF